MKELIDFKAIWIWMIEKWRTSFATMLFTVLGFGSGSITQNKQITDDCKFMGSFRDGPQAYNCNVRAR